MRAVEILPPAQRIMEAALEVRSARAEVLAGNVANADTPGYRARDINFNQALTQALKRADSSAPSGDRAALENQRYDRNDVDLNQQLARAYNNSLSYVATLKLYGDSVGRITTAISSS